LNLLIGKPIPRLPSSPAVAVQSQVPKAFFWRGFATRKLVHFPIRFLRHDSLRAEELPQKYDFIDKYKKNTARSTAIGRTGSDRRLFAGQWFGGCLPNYRRELATVAGRRDSFCLGKKSPRKPLLLLKISYSNSSISLA